MIKQIAWDTFKKTGDINTFLELKQFETLENNMKDTQQMQIKKELNITDNMIFNEKREEL